jgi:uncharacterized protein (TIGR02598 family)
MNTRGFSLVEVVLAIGIFAFVALAVVALLGQGMRTSRDARLESVASLLAGRVNSTLRASSAWNDSTITTNARSFTGNQSLDAIASGASSATSIYYDLMLSNVPPDSPDRQFAMNVRVEPFAQGNFSAPNAEAAASLASLTAAQNTVLLNVEVSFPALSPEESRSKRYFSSVITRTSRN